MKLLREAYPRSLASSSFGYGGWPLGGGRDHARTQQMQDRRPRRPDAIKPLRHRDFLPLLAQQEAHRWALK
jgi:hypothetical protein